jgi:uncharacterized membrane protein YbaN (DUF454 family)
MKTWKIVQVVGVLLLLLGLIAQIGGAMWGTPSMLLGVVMFATGRIAVWLKSDKP